MTSIQKKFLVSGMVLTVAVGYLAFAGVRSGWVYFVDVDQYVGDAKLEHQRVRLCGKVAEEGFSANPGALKANFKLHGTTKSVNVAYKGVIPDMFKAGRDAVVEGKLDSAGVFQADVLMTKCASKYEAGKKHPQGIAKSERS